MTTLSEIAKKLNLSKSSISKALNGKSDVSEETRKLVLDTVNELDYKVNSRTQKKSICIYIANIKYDNKNDFGYDIISEFKRAACVNGYTVNVVNVSPDYDFKNYENEMRLNKYVGSFILGFVFDELVLMNVKNTNYPTILLDNVVRSDKIACIGSDNNYGILQAVKHFKEMGHTRIAFYNGSKDSYISLQREHAFKNAMHRLGLTADKELMADGDYLVDTTEEILPKLLLKKPTAILCASDIIAINVMERLKQMKIAVPQTISVIGFDNLPICNDLRPRLTSIEQNRKDIGTMAFIGLNGMISGISISSLSINAKLIKRESVAAIGSGIL